MNTPVDPRLFVLKEKVASLEAALLSAHPTMPSLLREIHTTIRAYPESVTLLQEDEIRILVQGLEKQTQTHLASSVAKGAKKTAVVTKIKSMGADAF